MNYGPETKKGMTHIINKTHFERIMSLLSTTKGTIYGGSSDPRNFSISPTLVTDIQPTDILFQSEIFGPVLPILTYKTLPEATAIIAKIDATPLALYIMTEDKSEASYIINHTSSGGVAINDLMAQAAVTGLPFGGVSTSGNGKSHGKDGFDMFVNRRAVCTVPTDEGFEAMTEVRYATGDLEGKFNILKQMEEKIV